jgi:predicted dehydrogenase
MSEFSRRQFLHDALFAAAAAATASTPLPLWAADAGKDKGPNEKLQFAILGVHGRGVYHIAHLTSLRNDAEIAVICDVNESIGNQRCDEIEKSTGRRPKFVKDLRRVMDDPAIDCVSIATPNHWHSLGAIWAMQAGKDVYVEKPVSHNVSEGRRCVEAARKYNRICQTGTQGRSDASTIQAIEYVKSGKIGEVKLARGLCYKRRPSIGAKGTYEIPAGIDYDLWSGPAPMDPLTRPQLNYDWHWFWSTGNGDLGNQGVHQMDIARWGLGADTLPQGVIAYGGRFGYEDAGETPNTQVIVLDYGPKTLVFEVRGLKSLDYKKAGVGVIFEGSDGYVVLNKMGSAAFNQAGQLVTKFESKGDPHYRNFIDAVRSRQREDLTADILEGHLSAALCHLGNISYRLGDRISTSAAVERLSAVKMTDNAQETLDRTVEHLAQHEVKLDGSTMFQCGPYLKFDAKTESFPGNSPANDLCTREYRAPFVVPAAGQV